MNKLKQHQCGDEEPWYYADEVDAETKRLKAELDTAYERMEAMHKSTRNEFNNWFDLATGKAIRGKNEITKRTQFSEHELI